MEPQIDELNSNKPPLKSDPKPVQPQNPYAQTPDKPKLTAADSKSLLTINGLIARKVSSHSKIPLIVMAAVVLIVFATAIYAFSDHNTKTTSGSSNSNISIPNPIKNPLNSGGTINQQIKYCSNLINANIGC